MIEPSRSFDRAAEEYERTRPDYPPRVLDLVPVGADAEVLDVGAGTGKLTRVLARRYARVTAIEPLDGMRAILERVVPGVEALAGRAEQLPLPEGAVDAVFAGQAFHWFANDDALAEIHRVLKPGGALGLIWNMRDLDDPLQRAIEELIAPLSGEVSHFYGGVWRRPFEGTDRFGPLEEASFEHVQELDEQGLVDRVLSTSYVATAPVEHQREIEARLREVIGGDSVRLPYLTMAFVTRKL